MTNETTLWRLKFSVARGWEWVRQRECDLDVAEQWLHLFEKDEPHVVFKLSNKKPKLTDKDLENARSKDQ